MDTLVQVGRATSSQTATTLSRGEAQGVKLASELSKRDTGQTLYGLHFHDIQHLLKVLVELRERGNTVAVIEHNLDVIRNADRIIDLGPKRRRRGWEDHRCRDT